MTEKFSYIPTRVKVAAEGGHVCGAEDIIDDALGITQERINAIVLGDAISVSLLAAPTPVFVGSEITINLTASINTAADSIKIKKGSEEIVEGSGTSLSATDTITPSEAGNTTYMAEFSVGAVAKNVSKNIQAVYPIRTGSGASYVDGTALTTPKASPAGTYNVVVANDEDYVWFNVPSTMAIHGATMSGFNFPLEAPTNVTIDGVAYKSYRSSNTYDTGTLTIVIS